MTTIGDSDWPEALVFTTSTGHPLRPSNFRRRVWLGALCQAGLPAVHLHDLRHTGNNLTAEAGANLRELMDRMGHSSTRAALIYLHTTTDRQRAVADALNAVAQAALRQRGSAIGTELARHKRGRTKTLRRGTGDLGWHWWACEDLNLGPLPYQGSALTA